MGSERRSAGTVATRDGRWYAVVTLRGGGRHWTRVPDDGTPLERADVAEVARQLQRRYDRGEWDPAAPTVAPAADVATFYAHVRGWAARQVYESAPKELAAVERYLAACPCARLRLAELRPRHAVALVAYLKALPSARGGTLGHSPIASVYNAAARALDEAVVAEVLASNPLRLDGVVALLPARADKRPGARAGWRFTGAEVARLTGDPALPADRRVLYALALWTGLRPGELRALRVRDLDLDARPLGKLTLARAIKSVSRAEGATKTGAIKEVPIVPALARALRAWLATGWAAALGRAPGPDDLVVPSVRGRSKGQPRNECATNRAFRSDQAALGIAPPRHLYCARHTLVRALRDAGASRDVVRWATHAPPSSVYDGYAAGPPWHVLCQEFARLGVDAGVDVGGETPMRSNGSTEESKLTPTASTRQNPAGTQRGELTDSDGRGPLALTASTPARSAETAAHGWADRVLADDAAREWN